MSNNPFRQSRRRSAPLQEPWQHYQQEKRCDATSNPQRSHSLHHSSRQRRHRRSTRVQPDLIDKLDNLNGIYHHEGPFDAARPERNWFSKYSPLEALKSSNEEALKATPRENIIDCITKHRPLDGVAYYPPGTTDMNGNIYDYEEGHNMMVEDIGNFKRWPGMKFRDEDFKDDPFYRRLTADLQSPKWRSWGLRRRKNKS
ncbi:hypothetical protein VTO42DRAFT_812 [Malbranchea cinnamomea]